MDPCTAPSYSAWTPHAELQTVEIATFVQAVAFCYELMNGVSAMRGAVLPCCFCVTFMLLIVVSQEALDKPGTHALDMTLWPEHNA